MCVLHFFDTETGEELKDPSYGKSIVAVGKLLFPKERQEEGDKEESVFLEVALLSDEGMNNFEIVSDREVQGSFEAIVVALQELGVSSIDWVYQKMFENMRMSLGLPKEEKPT